jgi:hypothetical protein
LQRCRVAEVQSCRNAGADMIEKCRRGAEEYKCRCRVSAKYMLSRCCGSAEVIVKEQMQVQVQVQRCTPSLVSIANPLLALVIFANPL